MTKMYALCQRVGLLFSIFATNYLSQAFAAAQRHSWPDDFSLSEEKSKLIPEDIDISSFLHPYAKKQICSHNMACNLVVPYSGLSDKPIPGFCSCPAETSCNENSVVRTNDMEFHFCGHYKPPVCKRGQIALEIDGLQTTVFCRCRQRSLIKVPKSKKSDEFVCGKRRQKIWIKKMQPSSSEQNSAEYYNVYRR